MAGIKGMQKTATGLSYAQTAQVATEKESEAVKKQLERTNESAAEVIKKKDELQQKMIEQMMHENNAHSSSQAETHDSNSAQNQTFSSNAVEQESESVTTPVATTEVKTIDGNASKTKKTAKLLNKPLIYLNEDNKIVFNGACEIKSIKSAKYSTIGFSAPIDIALEVRIKASRDGLSLFELNNLLFALYLEKGLPKDFVERYRKSIEN